MPELHERPRNLLLVLDGAVSQICSKKGILWKQRLHQRTETRVCIFPGPD